MDNTHETDPVQVTTMRAEDLFTYLADRMSARYPGVKPYSAFLAEQDEDNNQLVDEYGNRPIANKPMYVIATENRGVISAYVSIRCRDTDSWMAPLVREIATGGYRLVTEERVPDRWFVGGEAWYREYRANS